jgi:endonuclease/exonuclease/phosphatase family metal-dependent hydrolase
MYTNIDSLSNKKDELLLRVDDLDPEIIAITEILPKNQESKLSSAELNISGYDIFVNERQFRGVALYLKSTLNANECTELTDKSFDESVWCEFVDANGEKVLIGCVYRSPNTSHENTERLYELLRSKNIEKYKKVCIMGDFNFPKIHWSGQGDGDTLHEFTECLRDAYLLQKVTHPTRNKLGQTPNILDLILVSEDNLISDVTHTAPIGKSDHDVLNFELYVGTKKVTQEVKYKYDLNRGKYDNMRTRIQNTNWMSITDKDVNESWNFLKNTILQSIEDFIPKVKVKQGKRTKSIWMTNKVLKSVKKKYSLYKRYLTTKAGEDYQKYLAARNKSKSESRKIKKKHERKIAKECKTNPKVFWKYVQEKTRSNVGISALKKQDNSMALTDKEKADTLNHFFANVFTREDITNIPYFTTAQKSDGVSLTEIRVTPEAVEKKLKELNAAKAQGPDLIPPRILKELSKELSEPLCLLFNKSLELGILPDDWKKAEVTAIFKKGSKSDPGNYRPVSLTCIACKILESFVRDAVVAHFIDNNLYSSCQHGFRNKRSCISQLLEVMEDFTKLWDNHEAFDVIYLDFRKAFDSVPHRRLLSKLKAYGISGTLLKWIENFLHERVQKVRVGSAHSSETEVLSGIPQGSILGPILFTVFINDLPHDLNATCKIFADDTKIYETTENSQILQNDLYKLQDWSDEWNLYFNVNKCKVMHYGKRNPRCEYVMNIKDQTQKLTHCNEEKDLGVTFDNKLSFDTHIVNIVNKANQMLGIIRRNFTFLNRDVFLMLYKALVRPHLEYGNVVWSPFLKRQSKVIEGVQRRATKIVKECVEMDYKERMKYLNLHSLKGRRLRGDLIEMYKIYNGVEDINKNEMFTMSTYGKTRNPEGKILQKHCNTNLRLNSFTYRIAPYWNNLPSQYKTAPNINYFKNLLDSNKKFTELFLEYDD